jgi:guanylate kinase
MVIVITGVKGSGKNRLATALKTEFPGIEIIPRYTTQPRRGSENPNIRPLSSAEFKKIKYKCHNVYNYGGYQHAILKEDLKRNRKEHKIIVSPLINLAEMLQIADFLIVLNPPKLIVARRLEQRSKPENEISIMNKDLYHIRLAFSHADKVFRTDKVAIQVQWFKDFLGLS